MNVFAWTMVTLCLLGVLYMLTFSVRLGRTEKTIKRAVELGLKHLNNPPLTPAEQKEVEELCRRGILEKVETTNRQGRPIVLYKSSGNPIRAELTS